MQRNSNFYAGRYQVAIKNLREHLYQDFEVKGLTPKMADLCCDELLIPLANLTTEMLEDFATLEVQLPESTEKLLGIDEESIVGLMYSQLKDISTTARLEQGAS